MHPSQSSPTFKLARRRAYRSSTVSSAAARRLGRSGTVTCRAARRTRTRAASRCSLLLVICQWAAVGHGGAVTTGWPLTLTVAYRGPGAARLIQVGRAASPEPER